MNTVAPLGRPPNSQTPTLARAAPAGSLRAQLFSGIKITILFSRPYTARGVRFNFWTSLYADDGGFIFRSHADLKSGCRCAYVTLLAFGLRMHVAGKTEALYVPACRSNYSTADLSKLDVTDATGTVVGFVPFTDVFRYLGSHVHWTLSDEFDVQHRISAASAAFGALSSTLCSR